MSELEPFKMCCCPILMYTCVRGCVCVCACDRCTHARNLSDSARLSALRVMEGCQPPAALRTGCRSVYTRLWRLMGRDQPRSRAVGARPANDPPSPLSPADRPSQKHHTQREGGGTNNRETAETGARDREQRGSSLRQSTAERTG